RPKPRISRDRTSGSSRGSRLGRAPAVTRDRYRRALCAVRARIEERRESAIGVCMRKLRAVVSERDESPFCFPCATSEPPIAAAGDQGVDRTEKEETGDENRCRADQEAEGDHVVGRHGV